MSAQGQETKKYPEPAPMQPEMSEFWTPQPKIVVPPDMDQAIITPPSDAIVLLGLDAESADEWVNCDPNKAVEWEVEQGVMLIGRKGSFPQKRFFVAGKILDAHPLCVQGKENHA